MAKITKAAPAAASDIDADAYYAVVLKDRAELPHETLPARDEPYTMRGRLLLVVLDKVASYTVKAD